LDAGREGVQLLQEKGRGEPFVTGEELVASIPRKSDRHVLSRQPRQEVGGDRTGVTERLVVVPDELLD
jgi:hypothetical protein